LEEQIQNDYFFNEINKTPISLSTITAATKLSIGMQSIGMKEYHLGSQNEGFGLQNTQNLQNFSNNAFFGNKNTASNFGGNFGSNNLINNDKSIHRVNPLHPLRALKGAPQSSAPPITTFVNLRTFYPLKSQYERQRLDGTLQIAEKNSEKNNNQNLDQNNIGKKNNYENNNSDGYNSDNNSDPFVPMNISPFYSFQTPLTHNLIGPMTSPSTLLTFQLIQSTQSTPQSSLPPSRPFNTNSNPGALSFRYNCADQYARHQYVHPDPFSSRVLLIHDPRPSLLPIQPMDIHYAPYIKDDLKDRTPIKTNLGNLNAGKKDFRRDFSRFGRDFGGKNEG